jgi:2-amino-4-hydroxy-6-hydroxymethyldihydropteridine diphosphokinase
MADPMRPVPILVALGSNLGDRQGHLGMAVRELSAWSLSPPVVSSWYETAPMYELDQPAFLNGVVVLEAAPEPESILARLLALEALALRVRTRRNGPRTLDCDLLAVGDCRIESPSLTLPHPRLQERPFVLCPLAEVAPGWLHPLLGLTALSLWNQWLHEHHDEPRPRRVCC